MKCLQCGKDHKRKKFCSNSCKARWHDTHNPRGIYAFLAKKYAKYAEEDAAEAGKYAIEDGWDGHKNVF